MAFVKGDPRINRQGRRPAVDKLINPTSMTGQELKEKELKIMLRGMKPLTRKAMERLGHMLGDDWDRSSQSEKIKIIGLIANEYQKLLNSAYPTEKVKNEEEDKVDKDELDLAPVVSFKVVGS